MQGAVEMNAARGDFSIHLGVEHESFWSAARWLSSLVCIYQLAGSACTHAPAPRPNIASPSTQPISLLMDVWSEREANIVAIAQGDVWKSAESEPELVRRLAARDAAYILLPSASAGTASALQGKLSGNVREDCFELRAELAAPSAALGFAIVRDAPSARSAPLQSVAVEPSYVAAVAQVIEAASGLKLTPTIEHAYRVDLDGQGKPEIVLQATHPELAGDPAEYKPEYYSLLVVLSDDRSSTPAHTGYLQAAQSLGSFEVLALDAVADVDLDGKLELLVRARHAEGWQTRVFRYTGALNEIFHSVGGEGQCPEASEE
jgi:hypothetical protein